MNNKTHSLVTIALGVCVVILFILQLTGKKATTETQSTSENNDVAEVTHLDTNKSETKSFGDLKIAYVNSDTVTMHYEYNKKLTSELMAKQASAENKIRKAAQQLQKDFEKFQQEAPIMGQSELERKQMELMQREQEIGMMEQELANQLADKGYKANYDYVMKTDAYLKKIGKQLGYDYIIGYRIGDLIMYANPDMDITEQVIPLLNQEYLADQTPE